MIKLFFCVSRRQDVSIPEFRRRWSEQQVPLLEAFATATGATRQVYNMTLAVDRNEQVQHLRGTRPPYDAVSEVWWDNARELEQAMASPELEALREHLFLQGEAFIDLGRSTLFFAQEQEIIEASDQASPHAAT